MNDNISVGKKVWAFAGGHIPLRSTGREPLFTSQDKMAILNTSGNDATVRLTIYYQEAPPVEGHELEVKGRRVRKVRFNDLIDPLPIPLDTPYGFVLVATENVVVQFSRAITTDAHAAGFCVTPYGTKQ